MYYNKNPNECPQVFQIQVLGLNRVPSVIHPDVMFLQLLLLIFHETHLYIYKNHQYIQGGTNPLKEPFNIIMMICNSNKS